MSLPRVRTISGDERTIPATMATQHPDNAAAPAWSTRRDGKVTLEMEVEEAYRNFVLGLTETMWDNEGKHADYGIGLKLAELYNDYFREHQLGQDVYITYRIPNRWKQKGGIFRHALTAITAENETLAEYGFHPRAFFEVILPFTEDQFQLLGVQIDYLENTTSKRIPDFLEVIPLIEGAARLYDINDILGGYVKGMKRIWDVEFAYLRPFCARSDPALDSGLVAADLFAIGALSEFNRFSKETGIPTYPIIGAGSCTFRGGLAPDNVERFVQKYPGYRTATLQSAFRYDYPEAQVRAAVEKLNDLLPESEGPLLDDVGMAGLSELLNIFTETYRSIVTRREGGRMPVADLVVEIADKFIPSHRERVGHVGYFGYSRGVENTDAEGLPRAIKYCAAFMALGVPPELIGIGSGLHRARERGLLQTLETLLPCLRDDLAASLRYVNKEALDFFARESEAWSAIRNDVTAVEEYTGAESGPQNAAETRHLLHSRNFLELYKRRENDADIAQDLMEEAIKGARVRRYLG